jgi:hypothetical protein
MAEQEPYSSRWPLQKAKIIAPKSQKLNALKEAENCEPDSANVHRSIANFYAEELSNLIAEEKNNALEQAIKHQKRSLELNPSKNNPSWSQLHTLYRKYENIPSKRNQLLKELEDDLGKQGKVEWRLLTLKVENLDDKSEKSFLTEIIALLETAKNKVTSDEKFYFERLKLRAYINVFDYEMIKSTTNTLLTSSRHFNDAGLAIDIAKSLRKIIGDEKLAAQV